MTTHSLHSTHTSRGARYFLTEPGPYGKVRELREAEWMQRMSDQPTATEIDWNLFVAHCLKSLATTVRANKPPSFARLCA